MRHFQQLSDAVRAELFEVLPAEFDLSSSRTVLAHALGATLYLPGHRPDLVAALRRQAAAGVRSMVVDLEDAVPDSQVEPALAALLGALSELAGEGLGAMLFVRVRTVAHIRVITAALADRATRAPGSTPRAAAEAGPLTGFVIPKFSATTGGGFLDAIAAGSARCGQRLLAMPVLETPEVLYRESRDQALAAVRDLLTRHREHVLAVRIGATDLCGLFGIRRDRDLTIYDVGVVAELIAEVVNHLGRADGSGFAVSGPVWEYFAGHERIFRPQLRETPFAEKDASSVRSALMRSDVDGLLREVVLDRANGLTGKTVIHPSHVSVVHALSVVPHEEYSDADAIRRTGDAGVLPSSYGNKMNETRPHRRWAQRIADRAHAFGVARPEVSHVDILSALLEQAPR